MTRASKDVFERMAEEVGPLPTSLLAGKPPGCPFCKRPLVRPTKHHLVPKTFGGKEQVTCCRDCHKAAHAFISNREMKRHYHTVERLLEHDGFRQMVEWIARQDPAKHLQVIRPNDQKRRGKFR